MDAVFRCDSSGWKKIEYVKQLLADGHTLSDYTLVDRDAEECVYYNCEQLQLFGTLISYLSTDRQ